MFKLGYIRIPGTLISDIILKLEVGLNTGKLSTFISFATALAAILNLIVIIWIFLRQDKSKKDEGELRKKAFWFRDVILTPGIEVINSCYINILSEVDKVNKHLSDKELEDILSQIQTNLTNLLDSVQLLEVLEPKLKAEIEKHIEEVEDDLCNKFILLREESVSKLSVRNDIKENKNFLFRTLFNFDMEI